MKRRQWIVIASAILLLGIGAAFLGFTRVPAGHLGFRESSGAISIIPAGSSVWDPLRRLAVYPESGSITFPAAEDTANGSYRIFTSEGAEVSASLSLGYQGPASPEAFRSFHAAAAGDPRQALVPPLKKRLREVVARLKADGLRAERVEPELLAELAPDYEQLGATLVSLTIHRLELAAGGEAAVALANAANNRRRVLVLGVDSADWTIIDGLRKDGRLPAFDRMVREGASGPLRSIEPLLSPLIWTTIATGQGPERHGILDFVVRDASGKMVPATSRHRRVPAVWNITSGYGRSTGVIGWLATWPAEAIDGFVISDRFGFLAFAGQAGSVDSGDLLHPTGLLDGREKRVVSSDDLGVNEIRRYIDVSASEVASARRAGFEKGNLANNFIHTLATAETWSRLGLDLWKTEQPDLELVYFEFLDAVSHLFMPYAPPRQADVTESEFRKYGRAVAESYHRQDEILTSFLQAAGDSTIVLVVSDHGFRSGDARLQGKAVMDDATAAHWHLPEGVILIHGPGVRPGQKLSGASVFDIAPTVLALLGCPATSGMTGRVLADAFVPGTFSEADTTRIAAPRLSGFSPPAPPSSTGGEPATAGHAGGGSHEATEHVNLGIVHARNKRPAEAESEFKKALEVDPDNLQAINNLASLYSQMNRHDEAIPILTELVRKNPTYAMGWSNLGVSQQKSNRTTEALESYDKALQLEPNEQKTLMNRGFLYMDLKRFPEAEADFRRALSINSRMAGARFGLGMALAEQGRTAEAVAQLEQAVALDPSHSRAREALGRLRAP